MINWYCLQAVVQGMSQPHPKSVWMVATYPLLYWGHTCYLSLAALGSPNISVHCGDICSADDLLI